MPLLQIRLFSTLQMSTVDDARKASFQFCDLNILLLKISNEFIRSLSGHYSFICQTLGPSFKANKCSQYNNDIEKAMTSVSGKIKNLQAVF